MENELTPPEDTRSYYERNKETIKAKQREYKKLHRKELKAKYKARHPEQWKAERKRASEKYAIKHHDRIVADAENIRTELKEIVRTYKEKNPCRRCGEKDPVVLQFHHINGKDKKFDVGNGGRSFMTKKQLLEEIEKCVLLCANCHVRTHYEETKKPSTHSGDMSERA